MTFLLDVNVLIALVDEESVHYKAAQRWYSSSRDMQWATRAITQNGALRILSQPRYRGRERSPALVAEVLAKLATASGHVFWDCDVQSLSSNWLDWSRISHPNEITDSYLLALAASRRAKLATFDRHLNPHAVKNGRSALFQIPA